MKSKDKPISPQFSFGLKQTKKKIKNRKLILKILNEEKRKLTGHQLYLKTNLSYRCIYDHLKEITECFNCHFFNSKEQVFCKKCGFRLVESYG